MRAAVLQQPGEPLLVTDVDDPTPVAGELVLRVDACGICGSDLHLSDAYPMPGLVMGHEFCGTVVAVGSDVDGFAEGDRVTSHSIRSCGRCGACLTGRPRKCLAAQMIGIERPGAFAEYVAVGATDSYLLPANLSAAHGALVEPLAVALHTVDRAGIVAGDDVLVLGAGPVGAAVTMWLAHAGAGAIVVSDMVDHRRELAVEVGATHTIDATGMSGTEVGDAFADLTGRRPKVVIECVGVPGLVQHAIEAAPIDGRVVVAGVCMAPDEWMPLFAVTKELDVHFAFYYEAKDYRHTVAMIDQGRVDPTPLITGEVGLDAVPDRFESLKAPTTDCKVLITP